MKNYTNLKFVTNTDGTTSVIKVITNKKPKLPADIKRYKKISDANAKNFAR